MKKALLGIAFLFLVLAVHGTARADTATVGVGDYTGSRNSGGGGITATHKWGSGNFVLSWEITDNGGGSFTYQYWIEGSGGGDLPKNISHWILQLTPPEALWTGVFGTDTEVRDFSLGESGNPLIPADVFGVKFDELEVPQFHAEFTVDHAPVGRLLR